MAIENVDSFSSKEFHSSLPIVDNAKMFVGIVNNHHSHFFEDGLVSGAFVRIDEGVKKELMIVEKPLDDLTIYPVACAVGVGKESGVGWVSRTCLMSLP